MKARTFEVAAVKQEAIHEFKKMLAIFLYLAFFFCAITTYRMLLLKDFTSLRFDYGFALINAFVFAKVILIGEYTHLGEELEGKPLILSSIYKALLFSLLVIAFHYFEEGFKRVLHGENIAGAFYEMGIDLLLARSLIIFSTLVPFFAFRELRRVLGEDTFNRICFNRSN